MSKRDKRRQNRRPSSPPPPPGVDPPLAMTASGSASLAAPVASDATAGVDWRRWVIPVLAGLGILDSLYLSYIKLFKAVPFCGGVGDCETVNTSRYSEFMGIPIAFLGVGMYVLILALAVWGDRLPQPLARYAPLAIFGISLGGVLYSAYLTYLELFVIEAICVYCVVSAILITLIFLWSLWTLLRRPQTD